MVKSKMSMLQRQELMKILYWSKLPVSQPVDYYAQISVRCFLNGKDPVKVLENMGVESFTIKRATDKARAFLGDERGRRRSKAKEILAERTREHKKREFTYENFRVKIARTEDRNYGMTSFSIYCVIEIWFDDDTVDKEYLVNYSDFRTKEWLIKLLVWALSNRREILIKPATQEEMSTMRMFVPKFKEDVS